MDVPCDHKPVSGQKRTKKHLTVELLTASSGCANRVRSVAPKKEEEGLAEGKVAWNSSAYETAGHWMERHGIKPYEGPTSKRHVNY